MWSMTGLQLTFASVTGEDDWNSMRTTSMDESYHATFAEANNAYGLKTVRFMQGEVEAKADLRRELLTW